MKSKDSLFEKPGVSPLSMGSYTLYTTHIKKKKKNLFCISKNELVLPPTLKASKKKELHLTTTQAERQIPCI